MLKRRDYRCKHGRFLVSRSYMTIPNPKSLSSNEAGVHPGIRNLKQHLYYWNQCQKASDGIYFLTKLVPTTQQTGLEFHNIKSRVKSGIFTCISWLNERFVFIGMMITFFEKSQDIFNTANVAS
jgi:hypothetical protein